MPSTGRSASATSRLDQVEHEVDGAPSPVLPSSRQLRLVITVPNRSSTAPRKCGVAGEVEAR